MATIATSRFALLKVDDELDNDDASKGSKGNKANQQNNSAKKRNKKKKKVDQQKENEELRNLAFAKGGGKPKAGGNVVAGAEASSHQRVGQDRSMREDKQWEEWQRVDKEFAADAYEQDLQQALMLSKLELEEQKKAREAGGSVTDKSNSTKVKKRKKDKPATMSLGEFQSGAAEKPKPSENGQGDGLEDKLSPHTSEPDPAFFNKLEADTQKIINREHIQEEYRKQYIVENARTKHFQDELAKKDAEIEKLTKANKKLEADLKEVKERNQQLCLILAQGEMKGKTTVLLELDQLKSVRDELTAEVASLTTELEKERSKVHALSKGSDKSKGNKHSK